MKISQELKDTVESHPHIEEVHFDKDGNHHFNVHKNPEDKKLYYRSTPVLTKVKVNEKTKTINKQTFSKEHAIVKTLSRENILAGAPKGNEGEGNEGETGKGKSAKAPKE